MAARISASPPPGGFAFRASRRPATAIVCISLLLAIAVLALRIIVGAW